MGIFLTGIIVGRLRLLYKARMNVWVVTGLAILGAIISMALIGGYLQVPKDFLGAVIWSHLGDRDGGLMDIPSNVKRGRLGPGCPSR